MTAHDLPTLNACLNGTAAACLIAGYVCIRAGRREAHRRCMTAALCCSTLFLISYLTHKILVRGHTPFVGPPELKPFYYFILASHIILAAIIVPLALITLAKAVRGQFEAHRRLARWTWPIWMYVSITGVLIYFILYRIWPAKA